MRAHHASGEDGKMRLEPAKIVSLVSVFLEESQKHLKFFTKKVFPEYLRQKSIELSKENFLDEDEFLDKFIKEAEKKRVLIPRKKARKDDYKNLSDFELNSCCVDGKYEFSNFMYSKFVEFMFDKTTIRFANFQETIFNDSIFRNSVFSNSSFISSSIEDSYVDGTSFNYSSFFSSYFDKVKIKNSYFGLSNLTFAVFENTNISGTKFDMSMLSQARFVNTQIENTIFNETNLLDVHFNACKIYGCDFSGANLDTIRIDETTETDSPVLLELIEKSKKSIVVP